MNLLRYPVSPEDPPRFASLRIAAAALLAAIAFARPTLPAVPPADQEPTAESVQPPPSPEVKHSLFLYLVDGMRAGELPAFGYEKNPAPNLLRMMEEGVTYLGAHAPSPWTVPSVTSLFTSLYPSAHTVQRAGDRLPRSARTLAEVLKDQGYDTALFSAHPLVGTLSGLDQGFDWTEEIPGPFGPPPPTGSAETSAKINARILAWIDKRPAGRPVFVAALSTDLLLPFGAPDPEGGHFITPEERTWYREVRGKLLGMRPGGLCLATSGDLKRLGVDAARFSRAAQNLYDGAIFYTDGRIRALREALEERGWWKRSLFLVTSTRGEEFGERGFFGQGVSLYDSGVLVPLLISYPPTVTSPRQLRKSTDHVDVFPTVLSMLGLPLPEGLQGIERNIEPTAESKIFFDRPAYAETVPAGNLPTGRAAMTREGIVKLIVHEEAPAGIDQGRVELFRASDPLGWEKRNLVASMSRIAEKRLSVLAGWREAKGKPVLEPDPDPVSPPERLKEVLRSLGYLQGLDPLGAPSRPSLKTKTDSPKKK